MGRTLINSGGNLQWQVTWNHAMRKTSNFVLSVCYAILGTKKPRRKPRLIDLYARFWLRGQDLNLRPSGYEPDELPGCSTPRHCVLVRRPNTVEVMRIPGPAYSRFEPVIFFPTKAGRFGGGLILFGSSCFLAIIHRRLL